LGDLLSATESVSDEDGVWCSGADGGQQYALGQRLGDYEFLLFKAKGSGHTAASRVEEGDVGTSTLKEFDLRFHLHERFLVAVAVQNGGAAGKIGRLVVRGVAEEEITEQEALLAQALGTGTRGEEIAKFVAEDAGAGGLEKNEGPPGVDFRSEPLHDALEVGAGFSQESKIIEWTAAADVFSGEPNAKFSASKDAVSGGKGLRVVVVVPGIWPQDDGLPGM